MHASSHSLFISVVGNYAAAKVDTQFRTCCVCAQQSSPFLFPPPLVCFRVSEYVSTTLMLLSRELPTILLLLLRPTMYASHRLACIHGMLAVSSLQTRRLLKAAGEGAVRLTFTTCSWSRSS